MKKLTLNAILLSAVASLTVACASQEATTTPEVTTLPEVKQPQTPIVTPLPEIQSIPQGRSTTEATDPVRSERDSIQFVPEPGLPSSSQSSMP